MNVLKMATLTCPLVILSLELIVNSIDNKGEGVEFTYFLEFVRQKIGSQTLEAISMDEAVRLTAKTIRVFL